MRKKLLFLTCIAIVTICIGILCIACGRETSVNRMGKQLYTMVELPHKVFLSVEVTKRV